MTTRDNRPVYVRDVAKVVAWTVAGEHRVWNVSEHDKGAWTTAPAISVAIAKRAGANAVVVADELRARIAALEGRLIPADVAAIVTRDYGETANEKANELLFHLGLATVSIVVLIAFAIGWREAVVTLVVIPTTILLTLFAANIMGYTINRVSLFALIFSIGILVDDAIVVVENIARHWAMRDGRPRLQAAIEAVAEVGNPTIRGDTDRRRCVAADAVRIRPDGALHGADPGERVRRHAVLVLCRDGDRAMADAEVASRGPCLAAARGGAWRRLARPALPEGRSAGHSHAPLVLDVPDFRRRRDAAGDGAVLYQERDGEAPAVRQQVGDRGRRRSAGRREPRGHRAGAAGCKRHCPAIAGGDVGAGLCRHRRTVQLQRPGSALLSARGAGTWRTTGQSYRPRRSLPCQPCHRA